MNPEPLTPYKWIQPGKGPTALFTAEQSRAIDANHIKNESISGLKLMQDAGYAAYCCLRETWPDLQNITILCGTGNNGGDGFIVAQHLNKEANVVILVLGQEDQIEGTAKKALNLAKASGLRIVFHAMNLNALESTSSNASTLTQAALQTDPDLWIDSIMGIGLNRAVNPKLGKLIKALNQHPAPIFAMDMPTGISADSGMILSEAIQADVTITFIALKQGLFRDAGKAYSGKLALASLGVSKQAFQRHTPNAKRLRFKKPLPVLLAQDTHKGKQGTLLCIGGNIGMPGAILMAAETALHTGVGKVFLATHKAHHAGALARRPELMLIDACDTQGLKQIMKHSTAILIGPGLGQDEWAKTLLKAVLDHTANANQPLLLDADALNIIASTQTKHPALKSAPVVITPHPGEAKKLLREKALDISNPFLIAEELCELYQCITVLKGAGTLTMKANSCLMLCDAGNPGLAKGGMGDVLSGTIAGLLAQAQMTPYQSAQLAVWLHATAADEYAKKHGPFNLLPSKLAPEIGSVLAGRF